MILIQPGHLEVLKWFFLAIFMILVMLSFSLHYSQKNVSHYIAIMYIILKITIGYYIYNINLQSLWNYLNTTQNKKNRLVQ